jgi:hypothetical protein
MKNKKQVLKAFGKNEFGLIDFPTKISNIQISRLLVGEIMGCAYCFPHGIETTNSVYENRQRNWKKNRKTKWK